MPESPDNLRWSLSLRLAPDAENIPTELRRRPAVTQAAVWVGDIEKGRALPGRHSFPCKPVAVSKKTSLSLLCRQWRMASFHMGGAITRSPVTAKPSRTTQLTSWCSRSQRPCSMTQIELAYLGGAVIRVGASDTAFGDRSSPFRDGNLLGELGGCVRRRLQCLVGPWSLRIALRPSMTPRECTSTS